MKITCLLHPEHDEFNPACGIRMAVAHNGYFIEADEPRRVIENWRESAHPELTTVFCAKCGALCRVEP